MVVELFLVKRIQQDAKFKNKKIWKFYNYTKR